MYICVYRCKDAYNAIYILDVDIGLGHGTWDVECGEALSRTLWLQWLFGPIEVHDLSLLILLRLAQVSLPPVLGSWRSEPLDVLHELQEIFAQSSVDHNDMQLKKILRQSHDFDGLAKSRVCMLDAWHRFVRRNPTLPRYIQAALLHWTWRRFHASLTVSQIRHRSFLLLDASGYASGRSWESHCAEVLHELGERLGFYFCSWWHLFLGNYLPSKKFGILVSGEHPCPQQTSMHGQCMIGVHLRKPLLRPSRRRRKQSLTLQWLPTCSSWRILDLHRHCKQVVLEIPRARRGTRGGTGGKILSPVLWMRFTMFLLRRTSAWTDCLTLTVQPSVWARQWCSLRRKQGRPLFPRLDSFCNRFRVCTSLQSGCNHLGLQCLQRMLAMQFPLHRAVQKNDPRQQPHVLDCPRWTMTWPKCLPRRSRTVLFRFLAACFVLLHQHFSPPFLLTSQQGKDRNEYALNLDAITMLCLVRWGFVGANANDLVAAMLDILGFIVQAASLESWCCCAMDSRRKMIKTRGNVGQMLHFPCIVGVNFRSPCETTFSLSARRLLVVRGECLHVTRWSFQFFWHAVKKRCADQTASTSATFQLKRRAPHV